MAPFTSERTSRTGLTKPFVHSCECSTAAASESPSSEPTWHEEECDMSLIGEYEPSRNERDRRQVELYEGSNGKEGGTMLGKPIIVVTFKGRSSGKIRKLPLMRIEHGGTYA